MKLAVGDLIEIEIHALGTDGEGVGRYFGFTLFVDGALPKEKVKARVCSVRTSYGRASLEEILTPSPHRVTPPCAFFGRCGGCQIMHLDYSEQLKQKRQKVKDALLRIGKIECDPLPCLPSPEPLFYRNKIQLPANEDKKLGLYAKGSHDIIPIDKCWIHSSLGEEVFGLIQTLLNKNPPPSLKNVLIKTTHHTQEALVVLVTQDKVPLKQLAHALMKGHQSIKGVVQNFSTTASNTVLGKEYITLAGQSWIEEILSSLKFKISSASFFQVNPLQAEILYETALLAAKLNGSETVLDAYCGVGTLSLFFARASKKVFGIESVIEAIDNARENAERNQIKNVTFYHGKVEDTIHQIPLVDIAILNPPRKGCDPKLLSALIKKRPSRIIYISCDPATLARDLAILSQNGFCTESVQPVDMFPQTMHVETVVSIIPTQ